MRKRFAVLYEEIDEYSGEVVKCWEYSIESDLILQYPIKELRKVGEKWERYLTKKYKKQEQEIKELNKLLKREL